MATRVVPIAALSDNYMYLIIDQKTSTAAVIDPVDPSAVLAAVRKEDVKLTTILTTHNHWDHAGGNQKMRKACNSITAVYGGTGDRAEAVTSEVGDGDTIQLGSTTISVLFTPCHTPGHVCYVCPGHVFTGDTMFVGGCGNFNRGTPSQMVAAFDKILALPNDTKVWVGHEYTLNNLKFASFADPENKRVQEKLKWASGITSIHQGGSGTIPSTIADEKATNPFARLSSPAIEAFTSSSDPVESMRLVRKGKDDWGRAQRAKANV